jgi:hypothetical protein
LPSNPAVTTVSATTNTGLDQISAGDIVTVTVDTSEPVFVTGTPTLELSDNEVATYTAGSGTNDLTFSYTVKAADNTNDLQVVGLNLPNGATITDAVGGALTGSVAQDLQLQVTNGSSELVVTIDGGAVSSGVVTQTTGGAPIASSYDAFVAFGDSNLDSGYFLSTPISNDSTLQDLYNAAVADGGGLPTTIGSTMNSVQLAQFIGQAAIPADVPGGTNYAASGATVTGSLSGLLAPSIDSQIDTYLTRVDDKADPNALYLLSGGGNDVTTALYTYTDLTDQLNYIKTEANDFANAIEQLHADGAQHILIDDFTGLGVLSATFDTTLWADLNNAGVPFLVADDDNVVEGITLNAAGYNAATGADITNTQNPPTGPFTSGPYNPANGGAVVNPDPSDLSFGWSLYGTAADQQPGATTNYLWADDIHLAGAGQTAEAKYAENLINTGVPTVGETLTANAYLATGLLTDGPATGVTFQWQEEQAGGTWQDIDGATGATYTIQNSDIGSEIRVVAFDGNDSSTSASTEQVICFFAGTLVKTDRGDLPVEALTPGNKALTVSGEVRVIKWIGRQTISTRFADTLRVLPIRVRAGAFSDNVPSRDLLLSPDHALLVGDVLIQAGALVNGTSIVRETNVPQTFAYYHIELEDHSLILAENTPAETFVDNVDRMGFDNWAEYEALYPYGKTVAEMPYPRAKSHRQVPRAIRERLAARAALLGLDNMVAA